MQKGYQLSLADQREQTLFAKRVPQQTVPVEMRRPLEELFDQLSKRNTQQAEEMLTGNKAKEVKTSEEHLNNVWALLADKEGRETRER